ncbi:MAG: hypothetical protein SGILL_005907, partial [Bacillariaceae sp.]
MSRSPLQSHQNRWRTATKRQILGNFHNNHHSNSPVALDGSNPQHIKMMIKDLQQKYDQIVVALKSELENSKMEAEEAQSTGIIKLPKAVRNMTVKDFNRQYSCDLLSLLKSKDGVRVSSSKNSATTSGGSSAAASAAAGQKRDYQHSVMETPAPRHRGQDDIPATAVRTARRGEEL